MHEVHTHATPAAAIAAIPLHSALSATHSILVPSVGMPKPFAMFRTWVKSGRLGCAGRLHAVAQWRRHCARARRLANMAQQGVVADARGSCPGAKCVKRVGDL